MGAVGIIFIVIIVLLVFALIGCFVTVQQGTVAIITQFGKYKRIMHSGLNIKVPFIETIAKRISVQNRSAELDFQAITQDQANVYFKAMLLYSVLNENEEILRNVAFKFVNDRDFILSGISSYH